MAASTNRNIGKVLIFAALAWTGYKIVNGISKNKSVSSIAAETIKPVEKVVKEVKKVTKKFLKGSPEAKAHMAKIRAKRKPKMVKVSTKKKIEYEIADIGAGGKEYNVKKSAGYDKAMAGKKGGKKTASKGKHKGHKSKKGLKLDQAKVSKEEHEKNYQKNKGT